MTPTTLAPEPRAHPLPHAIPTGSLLDLALTVLLISDGLGQHILACRMARLTSDGGER